MTTDQKSPAEVAAYAKGELKRKGLKLVDVARELGISAPSLSNQLSGKKYVNCTVSQGLANRYGLNYEFLTIGKEQLEPEEAKDYVALAKLLEKDILALMDRFDYSLERPFSINLNGSLCESLHTGSYETDLIGQDGKIHLYSLDHVIVRPKAKAGKRINFLWYTHDELAIEAEPDWEVMGDVGIPLERKGLFQPICEVNKDIIMEIFFFLEHVLVESEKIENVGELVYHRMKETKRKDDVSVVSIKKDNKGTVIFEIPKLKDKEYANFVSSIIRQQAEMGIAEDRRTFIINLLLDICAALYPGDSDEEIEKEAMKYRMFLRDDRNLRQDYLKKMHTYIEGRFNFTHSNDLAGDQKPSDQEKGQ